MTRPLHPNKWNDCRKRRVNLAEGHKTEAIGKIKVPAKMLAKKQVQDFLQTAVTLRDVTESDLPIFYTHQRDKEALAMADFKSRNRREFFSHWHKILNDASLIKKAILVNNKPAGNIGLFESSGQHLVGYWLGKEYWGKGITTCALALLLNEVTIDPIYAYVAKHNIGSIRVLEKCGFDRYDENETEFLYRFSRNNAAAPSGL